MQVTIQKALEMDSNNILEIFNRARAQMVYLPKLHTKEETRNYLKDIVQEGGVFVAKNGLVSTGFMHVKEGWVHHLYIHPDFQNQGVGKTLIDYAKSLFTSGLSLWVFEANTGAILFYEREGFQLKKKRDKDLADNEEHLADRKYVWNIITTGSDTLLS